MKEGVRLNRVRTGLATLAAFFVFGGNYASAQDTRSYIERQGFRAYEEPSEDRLRASPIDTRTFTVNTEEVEHLSGRLPEYGSARGSDLENDDGTIIVTASRQREIVTSPHPEFERSIFADLGMTTNQNLENEGLGEYMPIRPDEREGWRGVDVEIFDIPGPLSIEAQIKRGAGIELTYRFGGN